MSARVWWWLGALTLGGLALSAQELPSPLPLSTFGTSVDVRVVNVEAVVTDAKGERVRGLSAADLKLKVDGKEVPIEYFSAVEDREAAAAPPGAAPAESATAAAAAANPEGRSLLVFIDDVFSVGLHRNRVLTAIEESLRLLSPEDRMAVVAFGGDRVDVLCDWTSDRKALAAGLQAARNRPASGNAVLAARRLGGNNEETLRQASESSDLFADDNTYAPEWGLGEAVPSASGSSDQRLAAWGVKVSRATVAAMNGMAPRSGRRTLLLLSGGWPVPRLHIPLAITANRLGYTIYPVDVQGLDMVFAVNDASLESSRYTGGFITNGWEKAAQDGMEFLARITGGRAVLNTARLSALERVVEDTRSYYWLGFTPRWQANDRQHRIEVEVRRPGLRVRSRRGFSDLSRGTESSLTAQGILLVGGQPRDKRLLVETGPLKAVGRRLETEVTVAIPVADLTPLEQDGHWRVEAILAAGAVDKTGSFSDVAEIQLHLTLPAKPEPGALARYQTKVQLRRAWQRLVLTVRDPLGGAAVWGETEIKP